MQPRDEAVFLLTAAAEIEHFLMVQYLYAAYSVRMPVGDPDPIPVPPIMAQLRTVQDLFTQIAREEMGHLATVQNLLHLIGGPLNFNREHSPYASEIYPFRFTLEGLTLDSLAKYVIAESPTVLPARLTQDDRELLEQIRLDAARANDGHEVRHVGPSSRDWRTCSNTTSPTMTFGWTPSPCKRSSGTGATSPGSPKPGRN